MLPLLDSTIDKLKAQFDQISSARQALLLPLVEFIAAKSIRNEPVLLNFICTHNSRRSHMAQIWAQAAAHYYGITNVKTFSGGTEATAFNPNAVSAMTSVGFQIKVREQGSNPVYEVRFANEAPATLAFSKKFNDPVNPETNFAAVMTCSDADENCPIVPGSAARLRVTYNDPKVFDGTPNALEKYQERVNEIGTEMLFVFSSVSKKV